MHDTVDPPRDETDADRATTSGVTTPAADQLSVRWQWLAILVILLVAAMIRGRVLSTPLERDEGEYAFTAQMLLHGEWPYVAVYHMKLPGIYAWYAAILTIFGQSTEAIRLATLLVNAATTVLVFLLARRWLGANTAVCAAGLFAVLSLNRAVHGLYSNAEHFVLLPALAGIYLLSFHNVISGDSATGVHDNRSRRRAILIELAAGLCLGLAVLTKQHGAAFVLCGSGLAFATTPGAGATKFNRCLRAVRVLLYAAIPWLVTAGIYAATGHFSEFWFWTVTYAGQYSSSITNAASLRHLQYEIGQIRNSGYIVWLLAFAGIFVVGFSQATRANRWALLWFGFCSLLAVMPGWYFRPHYFLFLAPAAAMFAAAPLSAVVSLYPAQSRTGWTRAVAIAVPLIAILIALFEQRHYLVLPPDLIAEVTHGNEPFDEAQVIGQYIRERSQPGDTIAVIGSEPEIYFHAQRPSATGFPYLFALTENHPFAAEMRAKLKAEIEAARPRFIVVVNLATSWQSTAEKPDEAVVADLRDWARDYCKAHYRLVEGVKIATINGNVYTPPQYSWSDQAAGQQATTPAPELNHIVIFERIDDGN